MDSKARIMVVEDESVVGFDLKRILSSLHYDVVGIIRSGEEAFVKAFEKKPDLILMDIMLDGKMNGIEAAEEIKKDLDVPIIFLTAYADNNTLQSAKLTEPYGYVLKPFEDKSLQSAIEIALYKHKMEMKLKESERRYKTTAARLKEINESKDTFFSIISHDLRAPFDSILGFSEILKNEFKELSESEKELYIDSLYEASRHVYNLLNNLLQYSRFEADKIDFNPKEILLKEIVEKNLRTLGNTAEKKNINLGTKSLENLTVFADEEMLNSILINLISNGIKFTRRGGEVCVFARKKGSFTEVIIKDTGIGMDEATIFKLFNLNTNKSRLGTENEKGTGLGLFITQKYVEKNGGTLDVVSQINKGTAFSFTIPNAPIQ
ncbi:MAG TPA: response regulator [Ignavibacteriaceae bacterium]|nr:response regulator [Ignavibacteriaceae bacterium]